RPGTGAGRGRERLAMTVSPFEPAQVRPLARPDAGHEERHAFVARLLAAHPGAAGEHKHAAQGERRLQWSCSHRRLLASVGLGWLVEARRERAPPAILRALPAP